MHKGTGTWEAAGVTNSIKNLRFNEMYHRIPWAS